MDELFFAQHLVSDADVCLDQAGVRIGCPQFLAQGRHVDAQGDDIGLDPAAPYVIDQIGVGQDPAGVGGEKRQEFVLDGGQMDLFSGYGDTAGCVVDREVSICIDGILLPRAARTCILRPAARILARSSSIEKGLVR